MAGRGWGKTRTGAETVRQLVDSGQAKSIALIGRTVADARKVLVEGPSGILAVYPPRLRPNYEPSKRTVTFHNGAVATTFSGDNPEQLRGPDHDLVWCDELAAWAQPQACWDNMKFGLRVGTNPRAIITTTPRPIPVIRELYRDDGTTVSTGTTWENAPNLATKFIEGLEKRYAGTRIGKQELEAILLETIQGALWSLTQFEELRIKGKYDENNEPIPFDTSEISQIVVAIDPATTSHEDSDETGIVVCGRDLDGKGYVLGDYSGRYTPKEWAAKAIWAYHHHKADSVIAEVNQGGEMVQHTLNVTEGGAALPYRGVHASRGKHLRAQPVSALYEQNRIHHVGIYTDLEDQMTSWAPGDSNSPDRLDALVWGITELLVESHELHVGEFVA